MSYSGDCEEFRMFILEIFIWQHCSSIISLNNQTIKPQKNETSQSSPEVHWQFSPMDIRYTQLSCKRTYVMFRHSFCKNLSILCQNGQRNLLGCIEAGRSLQAWAAYERFENNVWCKVYMGQARKTEQNLNPPYGSPKISQEAQTLIDG